MTRKKDKPLKVKKVKAQKIDVAAMAKQVCDQGGRLDAIEQFLKSFAGAAGPEGPRGKEGPVGKEGPQGIAGGFSLFGKD